MLDIVLDVSKIVPKPKSQKALPALMQKLAATASQSARALEVTILTLARTAEVQNMRWSQLDLNNGIWDLGVLGTKNERPKRTPLPRQTL
jgi:integrase